MTVEQAGEQLPPHASPHSGWAVVDGLTMEPVWVGRFPTEDGAKAMLRRFQRQMNRKGYSPDSERLTTAFLASHVGSSRDAGATT